MKILGIETSCDETAAAVVENGTRILSNVVVSQIDIFAAYGGVIPEVAARSHLEAILPVIDKALADANCTWADIDAIAVTHAPGLLGSLLIGTLTARTLAILHGKPLYAVHHLKSHIYANWLEPSRAPDSKTLASSALTAPSPPEFPLLALVISGGHTQILYMKEHNHFEIIGTTRDDAVGECFDKVAKILGLPYPGGPSIAKAASGELPDDFLPSTPSDSAGPSAAPSSNAMSQSVGSPVILLSNSSDLSATISSSTGTPPANRTIRPGNPEKYLLPHPKIDNLDFSFSGLKTAVLRAVQKELNLPISHPSHDLKNYLTPSQVADFAASFQKTAIDILLEKLAQAKSEHPDIKSIVFAGGVSANGELRQAAARLAAPSKIPTAPRSTAASSKTQPASIESPQKPHSPQIYFPAPKFSGDNGAMVAAAAYYEIQSGVHPADPYRLDIYPRIAIA